MRNRSNNRRTQHQNRSLELVDDDKSENATGTSPNRKKPELVPAA
ncbi:hypothetical protein A2U01_0066298 [Trifolium medium]|uniref:Uncharacterized protein n=1 Tax=Trifolium medium TaxID=97028 RepID=A0A392S8P7_9FABA|nr:hypothetical protein [Trifolium medium]